MSALHAHFALRRLLPFLAVAAHHLLMPMAMAVSLTNLTVGDVLTPPGYITSPSGVFAFGFRAHDTDPAKFILATWFLFGDGNSSSSSLQAPQPQSVVWFAKESAMGATPNATARSVLSITNDGQLTLTDGSSQVLWTTSTAGTRRGSVLTLSDSGSVRFLGEDGHAVLWDCFWHPTDTLLPGQTLQGMLFSKRTDTEFATGRFSLAAQEDGNVVLCADLFTGDLMHNAYWATGTNVPGGNTTITFDAGTASATRSPPPPETATTTSSSPGWTPTASYVPTPDLIKPAARTRRGPEVKPQTGTVQSMCGPGSYCVETKERLSCMCPPGYTYIDAQHTDSGCTPAFVPQSCDLASSRDDKSSGEFSLVELANTTWEISSYYKKFPSVTEEQCRQYYLNDCFCTAALMINGSYCEEVGALANGRQGNDVTMMNALIKVRKGNGSTSHMETVPSASTARNKMARPYKIVTICLGSLFVMITVGILVVAQHYLGRRNRENQQPLCSSVRAFSRKELYQATNGFEKLLGKGSFGEVYKGTVRSPQPHLIAVKKLLDSNEYSEQEFANEVQSIGQIHHRNLVRMIGYCKQGKHRMLVFELMPGGSLRSLLLNPETKRPGEPRPPSPAPTIHCDIKLVDNILLDDHGIPRITDFGISKLLGSQQVHTTVTHVRGTRGYIAPEWLRGDARVDTKVDVYSFGVVLLEMICCRRCQEPVTVDTSHDDDDGGYDETVTLFGWAAQLVCARRVELLLHGDDADVVEDIEMVEKFARVALWCMEPNPLLRPTMHQVVQMLETRDGAQVEALPDPASSLLYLSSPSPRHWSHLKAVTTHHRRPWTVPSTLYIHSGNYYSKPHTGYNGQIGFHCVTRNREPAAVDELYQATNGFDKLLGKGSFGEVYKGTIRSPQPHVIAVKKLIDSNKYREQEFANEVQTVGGATFGAEESGHHHRSNQDQPFQDSKQTRAFQARLVASLGTDMLALPGHFGLNKIFLAPRKERNWLTCSGELLISRASQARRAREELEKAFACFWESAKLARRLW
ncbi:hypothetical protein HU200_065015 [Digitaria exilis]|uniref:non-specific serine/threonine protein kinase n=1 Tax=Digitaria exilis TaxID=1010633 RepID=A0A835DVI8_9POAL|nr:hypothetical protein HU200_065015 [Digitaria exilis]